MITWKQIKTKLISRKLWLSISSFISMLMIYFHADAESAESIASLIMAGASLIGYVIGEGLSDGNGNNSNSIVPRETFDINVNFPQEINIKIKGDD